MHVVLTFLLITLCNKESERHKLPKTPKRLRSFHFNLWKMGTKQKHVVFIYFWAQMQFCVLPLEYLNVDLKCVHMVRIHQNLFKTKKRFFLISYKMKERWMTDDAKTMDWLSHTSPSILMVVSTFLVKKHLNIYVWQTKRETFLCWFWEKSQNERNPPSSSNNLNKSSAGWQPRER